MKDKVIFIQVTAYAGSTQFFHYYLPWRDGPYVGAVKYATATEIEGQQTYYIDHVFHDDDVIDASSFIPKCIFKHECVIVLPLIDTELNYYNFKRLHATRGLWLKADEYLKFLDRHIVEITEERHPYVIQLERLRDDIKHHIDQIQNIEPDIKQLKLDFAPALSIPKTRFDQFMAQRYTQNGQRLGQAFFNFMDAHKYTQDKAWWDRLWNASDMDARGMINALIDWDN